MCTSLICTIRKPSNSGGNDSSVPSSFCPRAARRASQGETDSIAQRDKQDKQRQAAPLTCPEGAIRIDTGTLDLEGVVDHIAAIIENA